MKSFKNVWLVPFLLLLVTTLPGCRDKNALQQARHAELLRTIPEDADAVVAVSFDAVFNSFQQQELEDLFTPSVYARLSLLKKNLDTSKAFLFGAKEEPPVFTILVKDYDALVETLKAADARLVEKNGFTSCDLEGLYFLFNKEQLWIADDDDTEFLKRSVELKRTQGRSIQSLGYIDRILQNEIGLYLNLAAVAKEIPNTSPLKPLFEEMKSYNARTIANVSLQKERLSLSYTLLDERGNPLGDRHGVAGMVDKSLLHYLDVQQDFFSAISFKNAALLKMLERYPIPENAKEYADIYSQIDGTVALALRAKGSKVESPSSFEATLMMQVKENTAPKLFTRIAALLSEFQDSEGAKDGNDIVMQFPFGRYVFGFRGNMLYFSPSPLQVKPQPNYSTNPLASTLIQKDMGYTIVSLDSKSSLANMLSSNLNYPINGHITCITKPDGCFFSFYNEAASVSSLIHRIVVSRRNNASNGQ